MTDEELIVKMSSLPDGELLIAPEEFFLWFDKNWEALSRNELTAQIQAWVTAQTGKSYGSFEANAAMVNGLRRVLDLSGLLVICPGSARSGACGEPSRLVFVRDHNDKSKGVFRFKHLGQQQLLHGTFSTVPSISVCQSLHKK